MKNMYLISSSFPEDQPTFKMIPITSDCPYLECIYDSEEDILGVVSKEKKEQFHMIEKENELEVPEERVLVDTYYEYYIQGREEITQFVMMFAVNAGEFDFDKYLSVNF